MGFPIGTRFWKEFAFDGRPVETRYMERRRDGSWLFSPKWQVFEVLDRVELGPDRAARQDRNTLGEIAAKPDERGADERADRDHAKFALITDVFIEQPHDPLDVKLEGTQESDLPVCS